MAFIYRRPSDTPATKVTRKGTSGALDVLATGYLVVHGTHENGQAIYLEGGAPAEAPRWAVAWLTQAAERRATKAALTVDADEDAPPFDDFNDYELKVWRGEIFKAKPEDGTIDTSASLVKLGRLLYDRGMSRALGVRLLAERDAALHWRKYTDRPDAEQQYQNVWLELEANGRNPRSWPKLEVAPPPKNGNGNGHHDDHAACRERIRALEADNQRLRDFLAERAALRKNPNLKPAVKIVADWLGNELVYRESVGKVEPFVVTYEWTDDKTGEVRGIATETGLSRQNVGRVFDLLHEHGAISKMTRPSPTTGNKQVVIDWPDSGAAGFLASVARLDAAGPKQGGWRGGPKCEQHPDAALIETWTCSVCKAAVKKPVRHEPEGTKLQNVTCPPEPPAPGVEREPSQVQVVTRATRGKLRWTPNGAEQQIDEQNAEALAAVLDSRPDAPLAPEDWGEVLANTPASDLIYWAQSGGSS